MAVLHKRLQEDLNLLLVCWPSGALAKQCLCVFAMAMAVSLALRFHWGWGLLVAFSILRFFDKIRASQPASTASQPAPSHN
jgi:hypothetical protein